MMKQPIPIDNVNNALSIFLQLAQSAQLYFHDISEESQEIDEVVLSMEGGPYQEYFYISIPIDNTKGKLRASKRFVYVHEENSRRFPFQFGNDVAAQILGCLERANWKNCLLAEDGEIAITEKFRACFEKFDFTL